MKKQSKIKTYETKKFCTNCYTANYFDIPKGTPMREFFAKQPCICYNCECDFK